MMAQSTNTNRPRSGGVYIKHKATPMSKGEMVEMVRIFEKYDYDCKMENYDRPNSHKDWVLEKVLAVLEEDYGVKRTKDQIKKRWSDLKHREQEHLDSIHRTIIKKKDQECGQHQPLQDNDDSAGPSKEPPVDSTSPDTRYAEGEGVQEIQDEPLETVVCPSHQLPGCAIGRISADMLQAMTELENLKEAATGVQRRIRDYYDLLAFTSGYLTFQ